MRPVQHAQLHGLVGHHIVDQCGADQFQWRPIIAEMVLDYPLAKRFGQDGGCIFQADAPCNPCTVFISNSRHDAVNH